MFEIFFANQTAIVFGEMLGFIVLGWWFGRFTETREVLLLSAISAGVALLLTFTGMSFVFTPVSILFFLGGGLAWFGLGYLGISWWAEKSNPY